MRKGRQANPKMDKKCVGSWIENRLLCFKSCMFLVTGSRAMCERLSASVFEATKGFRLAIVKISRH